MERPLGALNATTLVCQLCIFHPPFAHFALHCKILHHNNFLTPKVCMSFADTKQQIKKHDMCSSQMKVLKCEKFFAVLQREQKYCL